MKVVTEFPGFVLSKALLFKNGLVTEGKTPEEIQAKLGETYKLEGDKLTYFNHSLDVAGKSAGNLKRVIVMRLGEGETSAPAGSTKIDELYYIAEILNLTAAKPLEKSDGKGGRHGRGGGKGGPKESPWGLSPEEKAAKLNKKPGGTPTKPA